VLLDRALALQEKKRGKKTLCGLNLAERARAFAWTFKALAAFS
jgi:hypothetical protein